MTTYSISLDEVDLALLPLRTHKYNDFMKKEHFQFQVMKADEEDESEPTIFYKCHICAIDVPAAFAREHALSVKHRANARIANVAAERTRALISALPLPVVAQNARFCANCAIIVGKNHEKTKEHRVAVMHDKLLWELMNAYVGEHCDSEEDFSDTDDFVVKEANSRHYNGFATWTGVSYNKEEKQNKGTKLDLLSIENNKKVIDRKEDNEAEKNDKYKESVDSTTSSEDTYVLTLKYESANNSQVTNVETNKYQSSKNSELTNIENGLNKSAGTDNKITDRTAKTDAKPSTSLATEMNTSIGTDREITQITTNNNQDLLTAISTPSTSKAIPETEYVEFLNKVNKTVKVFSDYYHSFTRRGEIITCKVCRTSFNNDEVASHMFSLKHLNKMPSYMIDEHFVRKIDDVFSHCIVCNQMIKHTNLAKHYLTINHSQREKQLNTDNPNNAATTSKTANIPKCDAKIDKPAFFDVIVNTADTNAQTKTAEVKVKTPEVKVKSPEVNTHNEVKPIDWPVIYPYEMTKQGVLQCVICNCNVPNNPGNRKEHLVGLVHVRNVKTKRVYPYSDTELDVNFCFKCGGKVPISLDITNLNGWSHANKQISRTATEAVHSLQITQKPKLEYPYEATMQASIARCVICDMNVTISTDNLKGHLDGLNHSTNVFDKKVTIRKAFAATEEASVARCIICNINVPKTLRNQLDHLLGSSHMKKEKNRRETQQSPVPRPVKMTPAASKETTYESASDTIGRKSYMYFSWI